MTKEEILNMPAGEEIDNLVAEKVMGWHKGIYVSVIDGREFKSDRESWLDAEGHFMCGIGRYPESDSENFHTIDWHPSDSILWAWDVVEMLRSDALSLGWRKRDFQLMQEDRLEGGLWVVKTDKPSSSNFDAIYAMADAAPLAICRAALLAVEAE